MVDARRTVLRVARPTERLAEIAEFYMAGLGFQTLAAFEDHAGFDGVVLGSPEAPYHLEFTRHRGGPPPAAPPADSLLVFYVADPDEWERAVARVRAAGGTQVASVNPYWDASGLTFADPDGFRIVLQRGEWRL